MRTDNLNLYIWIIDTISAHGHISRSELSDLWQKSSAGDGNPIPHRSFFSYRRDIERIFGIEILCDSAYRYYIEKPDGEFSGVFREWMLDSYALRHAMADARDISDKIMVEKVPSARQYLSPLIDAIRRGIKVCFTYNSYLRPLPQHGIVLTPFFLRLYKQRWYVTGSRKDESVRTYALDRISDLTMTTESFDTASVPAPQEFFSEIYGITYSRAEAQEVKLKVKPHYANYLRALPLHSSQQEHIFSDCSIFTYRLRITPDLVRELISAGSDLTVLAPRSLVIMLKDQLNQTLANYE